MFLCEISYEEALKRHPNEVANIIKKLRKGKSEHKNAAPETLKWTYECAIKFEASGSFEDLLSGKITDLREAFDALPFHEKVKKTVADTSTSLYARIGRWYAIEAVPNPKEVTTATRARLKKKIKVDKKWEKIPEEERKAAAREALDQLKGTHGFVSVGFQLPKAFKSE